ncbi:hypothetical protein O181_073045 [Austropuccinia psidii MF-1]|uniref:Uncharacterized protein n=1 Tax=Austropuccinia psidii MF-1 TaxID=1389203 RepID=A0A9Q3F9S7_9BASI|nr:hypothetical protein [Austropuccinia psidii MF-1]
MSYDQRIYNLTEEFNQLTMSVEKFKENTSSKQKLILETVEKDDKERMKLEDDIKSEIRFINEKMDKINGDSLNIPKLSTSFSYKRSPIEPKEEMKNAFIEDMNHKDKRQVLMK